MKPILPKAVVFDLDDTLIESFAFFRHQLDIILKELLGPDYDPKHCEMAESFYIDNIPFEDIFHQTFGDGAEAILQKYRKTSLLAQYQAKPGMLEFVTSLSINNIVMMILSNRTNLIEHRLTQSGFDPTQFRILNNKKKKPHPLAFVEVIKTLDSLEISAKETIFIGNHPDDYHVLSDNFKLESSFFAFPYCTQHRKAFQKLAGEAHQNLYICDNISEVSKIYGRIF